jgi:hypothetical protein
MKFRIIVSLCSLLLLLAFSSVSYGDVIDPGMKNVEIYYQVSNIQNYPDYVFLIHGNPSPSLEIINSNEFTFYKFSTVSIYAISKTNFNENELKNMNESQAQNFLKTDSSIIKSDLTLHESSKTVNNNNPLEKILITLNINSIDNETMNVTKSKVTYTYNDGSVQEETFIDQNSIPEPSKNSTSLGNDNVFYIVLPLIAILALGVIIIRLKK